jgi:hypothetical protein
VTIEAVHAPGHTSEMVTYLVNDDVLLQRPPDVTVLLGHVSVTDDDRFENASPGEPVTAKVGRP